MSISKKHIFDWPSPQNALHAHAPEPVVDVSCCNVSVPGGHTPHLFLRRVPPNIIKSHIGAFLAIIGEGRFFSQLSNATFSQHEENPVQVD